MNKLHKVNDNIKARGGRKNALEIIKNIKKHLNYNK